MANNSGNEKPTKLQYIILGVLVVAVIIAVIVLVRVTSAPASATSLGQEITLVKQTKSTTSKFDFTEGKKVKKELRTEDIGKHKQLKDSKGKEPVCIYKRPTKPLANALVKHGA